MLVGFGQMLEGLRMTSSILFRFRTKFEGFEADIFDVASCVLKALAKQKCESHVLFYVLWEV